MKKSISLSLLALLLVFTLFGCSSGPETTKNQPVKVVVAVPQDPDYLDPHLAAASGTQEMMFNVFEGLLKSAPSGELVPAVAKSYQISEDGLIYTFVLRDGIKFHNGNLVTMDDVLYSYQRLKGDITGKPLSNAFAKVEKIEVVDKKTIRFIIPKLDASFIVNFTEAVIPADLDEETHNKAPISTGPFKFVEYEPSQKVVIEKFADYWQEDLPKIDQVEFRIIADSQTGLMSLLAGEIDMYPRFNAENLDTLPENYYFIEGMQNMVQLMAMNNKIEPLNNLEVRKAINFAINIDEIIEAVANGRGTKLGSNMSPAMEYYYEKGLQDKYNQNIKKAKQLLGEAGYKNGFRTSITVPSNYSLHVSTAEVIAEQLKKVGISVEIKLVEWGVWLDKVYKGRDYEMTIIGLTGKLDPHNILYRYETGYARNFFNYSNSQYDQLMQTAIQTTDLEKRAKIYKDAQKMLAEEVPAVYIMDPNIIIVMKENLKGYQLYPIYVQDMSVMYVE